MNLPHIFFIISLIVFLTHQHLKIRHFKQSYDVLLVTTDHIHDKKYDLKYLINNNLSLTREAAAYFLQNNLNLLLSNFKKIKPMTEPFNVEKYYPYHQTGQNKSEVNYLELINSADVLDSPESPIDEVELVYLIVSHSRPRQLMSFINHSMNSKCGFIISVDQKANITEFKTALNNLKKDCPNNAFIMKNRIDVRWATFSIVLAELHLMQAARKIFPKSKYITLHSGVDYSIRSPDVILNFLNKNYPKLFISIGSDADNPLKIQRHNRFVFHKNYDNKRLKKIFPNREIPSVLSAGVYHGTNWFTIPTVCMFSILDIVNSHQELLDFFESCYISDEMFFQSIIKTTKFGNNVVNCNLMHVDWATPNVIHPKVFDEGDFNVLTSNPCHFWARKFDLEKSPKIIEMINNHIKLDNLQAPQCQI